MQRFASPWGRSQTPQNKGLRQPRLSYTVDRMDFRGKIENNLRIWRLDIGLSGGAGADRHVLNGYPSPRSKRAAVKSKHQEPEIISFTKGEVVQFPPMSGLLFGLVAAVVINFVTALFSRDKAIKLLPWLALYLLLHGSLAFMNSGSRQEWAMILASHHTSRWTYWLAILGGAVVGATYWFLVNEAVRKLALVTESHSAVTVPDLAPIKTDLDTIKKNTTPVPDRHLTVGQIQFLQTSLKVHNKQPIRVSFLVGDVESQKYAQEFVSVLGSPPLNWESALGLPSQFNFSGMAIAVQDPTDVPPAAEALALSLEELGIKILRIPQSNAVSIDGNKANPIFSLWISNKGETTLPLRKKKRLHIRYVNSQTSVRVMSDIELEDAAHDLAGAMRLFEADNKEQFANEWHIAGTPLEKGSYRFVFENYRKRAIEIRMELWKRLNSQPATTFALDADYLGGPAPITDSANYLDELARQLRGNASARQP